MIVNFKAREINRDTRKLARTFTLIKKKIMQIIHAQLGMLPVLHLHNLNLSSPTN
jgi:hypothetical protein